MKNLIVTIAKSNSGLKSSFQTFVLLVVLLIGMSARSSSTSNENNASVNATPSSTGALTNPYFSDIINKIKMGHFFNATVSTLNEKTRGKEIDVYSSYGFTQDVNKLNDQTLELKNLSTAFSDRAFFSGSKTVESIILTENGNEVNIEVTFITWSNTKAILSNVILKKINKVTFLTGYVINGSNATYYTIALQDMGTIN